MPSELSLADYLSANPATQSGSIKSTPGLRFGDLASNPGVSKFLNALGGSPELSPEIKALAIKYLEQDPTLRDMEIGKVPKGRDAFNWGTGRLAVSSPDPDILSHEASHAKMLREESLYRDILGMSKRIVGLNNLASIPAILGIRSFLGDSDTGNTILKTLAGASILAAAPNIIEETRATAEALAKSDDKLRTAIALGPGLASHYAHDLVAPTAYYLAGSKLD
jgi:hypothetical protein